MSNALLDPPFAKDPPVKINVNAQILGLVIGILAVLGAIFALIGLLAAFGACTVLGISVSGCGTPILWILGDLLLLIGYIVGAIGGFRMYQQNPEGKNWAIYGIALGVLGNFLYLIGNIIFYSSSVFRFYSVGTGGAVVGFIFGLIISFIVYYLVVVSRFPGQAPIGPPSASSWGGPSAPPPPPV